MPFPKIKISDDDGNVVGVDTSSNALNVKLVESIDSIDIGDVSIKSGDGTAITDTVSGKLDVTVFGNTASDGSGTAKALLVDGTYGRLKVEVAESLGMYTEDSAHVNGDKGMMMLGVQDNSNSAFSIADGDYAPLKISFKTNSKAALVVTGGTIEDQAHVSGDGGIMALGVRMDYPPSSVTGTIGDYAALITNSTNQLWTALATDFTAAGITVGIGHVEDRAHGTGCGGIVSLAVRNDDLESLSGADNDYSVLQVNADGALYTTNVSGTTITSYAQFDVDTSAFALSSASGINSAVTTAKEIIIQCGFTNTGYIVVGDSGIVAAEGVDSMDGIRLEAGDTLTLAATTTANIYLRGSANDQLVNVMIIS